MRILHTSDWHLGRQFHGQSMLAHQEAFLDHLVGVIEEREVDLLVVAGDVFDRALPPVDAVALADEAFAQLARSRARVVVTSGNHDSATRLGLNSRLIDAAGFHLRTEPDRVADPVLLDDEHGPVAVYGIPYLEPDLLRARWDLPARSHQAVLGEAVRRIRGDLAARPASRAVVVAHAFVAGGEASDSERDIAVGGVALVPTGVFDGIDYVALGHLHGRAVLSGSIRYSGSPLAYSFSEAHHLKGSWLVDLGADGLVAEEFVPAPVPRRLARVSGRIDDLLADPRYADLEDAWLQVSLTDEVRPAQAMARLQQRFPHAVALQFTPASPGGPTPVARAEGRTDHDIALDFVTAVRGTPATAEESALLLEACDAAAREPDADPVA
ncbi:MAG: exonuclease SbcCD subunit D C-terminal domain-containing protein [Nocardioidaceae bacterium]|nr:exonuclease SbcCD subunit D C-terminal domain-containing protein [Nocardioidaceae bacterium]